MGANTRKHIRRVLAAYESHRRELVAFVFAAFMITFGVTMILHDNGVAANNEVQVLDCHFDGVAAHSHDASCFDADGNLVCPLPEIEKHTHTGDCYVETYELTCDMDEHAHGPECYGSSGELVCDLPEHAHDDSCYASERILICGQDEVTDEHVHGRGCFSTIVIEDPAAAQADDGMEYSSEVTGEAAQATDAAADLAGEPEDAEAMPAQRFTHSIKDAEDRLVLRVDVDAPEGALPVGTTMVARWVEVSDLSEKQLSAVSDAVASKVDGAIYAQQAVDVKFQDPEGAEVKPERRVAVTLTSALLDTKDLPVVAHIDDLTEDELVAQAEALRSGASELEAEPERRAEALDKLSDSALSELGISLANNQVSVACDSFSTFVVSLTTLDHAMSAEGETVRIEADAPAAAGLPADAQLRVSEVPQGTPEWVALESDALAAVESDASDLTRVFDVSLVRADGTAVEPLAPVSYKIELADAPADQASTVVRLADDAPELLDSEANDLTTKFESDAATATYGIVYPEEITTRVITASGETYEISVAYGPEAGIPAGAELQANEILPDDDGYDAYVEGSAEALSSDVGDINHIRVFDISIQSAEGEAVEPAAPVQVRIAYAEPAQIGDSLAVQMVHFGEERVEVIAAETNLSENDLMDEVSFEAESFSAYAIVATGTNVSNLGGREFAIVNTYTHDAMKDTPLSDTRMAETRVLISNNVITAANPAEEISTWRFTAVPNTSNQYYIQNKQEQYLHINGDYSVTLSDNPQPLTLTAGSGNHAGSFRIIGTNGYCLDDWEGDDISQGFGSYPSQTGNADYEYFRLYGLGNINKNAATIHIHYVDEGGNEIATTKNIDQTTKVDGATNYTDPYIFGDIYDLYQPIPGYAYQYTRLQNGTRINAEVVYTYADSWNTNNDGVFPDQFVRAAQNRWEYQEPGKSHYYNGTTDQYSHAVELQPFANNSDVYVVYKAGEETIPSHGAGGSGGGSGEQLDEPRPKKDLKPNDDGTYELSLSVNASSKETTQTNGANVILIFDMSASMGGMRITDGRLRVDAAKEASRGLATSLLALNAGRPADDPLVELKVVPFNIRALNQSDWLSVAGPNNAYNQNQGQANGFINSLNAIGVAGGTNWEDALRAAKTAADAHQDGDDTYIIFVTDGNPWMPAQVHSHDTYSRDFFEKGSYIFATEPARDIVKAGYELYGVGIYGNVDVLHLLLNFAYNARSTYDPTTNAYGHYYLCQEQDALVRALSDIAGTITGKLAMAGVEFRDGIALSTSTKADTTMSALNNTTVNVGGTEVPILTGITYSKSAGSAAGSESVTVTVGTDKRAMFSINGATPQEGSVVQKTYTKIITEEVGGEKVTTTEDATTYVYQLTTSGGSYEMPIATLSAGGDLDWDLSPLGTLEDGATYKLSTTVWPNQEAYNLVTDLNNGTAVWNDQAAEAESVNGTIVFWKGGASRNGQTYEHIVKYPNGTYAALSNTYQTLDYYVVNTEGGNTTYTQGPTIEMDFPRPMDLTDEFITLKKVWDTDTMGEAVTPSVSLDLLRDNSVFLSGIQLNQGNDWTEQKYIATGLMITKTEADRKGITGQVVSYDGGTDNYVILNSGYDFQFVEHRTPDTKQFELEEKIYHPMLVEVYDAGGHHSVLKNVKFETTEDGIQVTPTTDDLGQGLVAKNIPKGMINIKKVVRGADNEVIQGSTEVFDVDVTLTAPIKDGKPDFTYVEDLYEYDDVEDRYAVDQQGNYIVKKPSIAWYQYYNSNGDAVVDDDVLSFAIDGVDNYDGDGWFYLDFVDVETSDDYGVAKGTVKVHPAYTLRFVDIASGTAYSVEETEASRGDYEVGYSYTRQAYTAGGGLGPEVEDTTQVVAAKQASNATITNKQVKSDLILIKADEDGNPITSANDVATFKLTKNTESDGSGSWENAVDLDNDPHLINNGTVTINSTNGVTLKGLADGLYKLEETKAPDGYIILDGPVTFRLAGGEVTFVEITSSEEEVEGEQTTVWTVTELDVPEGYTLVPKTTDTPIVGIKINNTPGAELPHSGGRGVAGLYASGIAMIVGAAAYLLLRKREAQA